MRDLKNPMENSAMTRSVLLMGALVGSFAMAASENELNVLNRLELVPVAGGARLTIKGTKAPVFTVFRLNDPDRLVIDVTNASKMRSRRLTETPGPLSEMRKILALASSSSLISGWKPSSMRDCCLSQ